MPECSLLTLGGGCVGLAFVSVWTVVTASCLLCICLTAEASFVPLHCCPEPIIALGSDSPSPWTHFIDVLFDLKINVDDKILTLWLPSRGSAGCAVQGPWLLPLLSLAESSVPFLVAKRQQDLQLLLNGLNDFLFCTKVSDLTIKSVN